MKAIIFVCVFLIMGNQLGLTQMIQLDQGIQMEGLWCFPIYGDSLKYRYLPAADGGRIVMDQEELPKFSFMRYIIEAPNQSSNTVSQADGGGIVNFLVEYSTSQAQIAAAEEGLKEQFGKDVQINGPVIITTARYTLVSSILTKNGEGQKQVLATGGAPVLENGRLAFSFDLSPERSKLLLENFKMNTPDISIVFELGFSGLSDYYEANLHVDWNKVNKSKAFGAGGSIYYIGADVELGFDELFQESAISLNTVGSNQNMESLLATAYDRLLSMMFKEVESANIPTDTQGGLMDAVGALFGSSGLLNSRDLTGFGLNASFKIKELKSKGFSDLKFQGRSTLDRYHFISFNVGDLFRKFGQDKNIFRDVPLYDKAFQQRDVYVSVDGSLKKEFEKMVNNVTVKLKKVHTSTEITVKEILVNKQVLLDTTGQFKFTYLNHEDNDMQEWMEYEYQTIWQFAGGGIFQSGWVDAKSGMINLFTPFQRKEIVLEGDLEFLKEEGYRAIVVSIEYPFFNEIRKESISVRPTDDLATKSFEVTLPIEQEDVQYSITWVKQDGTRIQQEGTDNIGILFIDEIPIENE